ncbi:ABC transporter ATP-binding protein [Pendulispora rubella]|uniref:ABC transporter ATP-binding protein n=1 Tax=Pendulispora rubella TaxID=2741070 RepID=A0ABZ2L2H0_9BACT
MLEVDTLTKYLGGRRILDAVSFSCAPSQVLAIVGPNGTGKSTLLRIVAGVILPDRGQVRVRGVSVSGDDPAGRRGIGYVPDATEVLPELLVCEFVNLVAALKGVRDEGPRARRQQLGLDETWNQRLGTLSFGQRKRAFLLAALLGDPDVLVLDEPSNGIDPEGIGLVGTILRDHAHEGGAVLLSTNDMPFLTSLSATSMILENGTLGAISRNAR